MQEEEKEVKERAALQPPIFLGGVTIAKGENKLKRAIARNTTH